MHDVPEFDESFASDSGLLMFRTIAFRSVPPWIYLALALLLTMGIYLPGARGAFLFDDFPNIVDNTGVHPTNWSVPALASAALSSPSSEFKRPLASLTFAMNYLAGGLDPYGMKLTNIVIHLFNGLAAFLLLRLLFAGTNRTPERSDGINATIVVALWLVLPINLSAVLYVVQRMESLANLFVLLGLLGYVWGRRSMLAGQRGFAFAVCSLLGGTLLGLLAKETAVLTPLYAGLIEWIMFHGRCRSTGDDSNRKNWRVIVLFAVVLAIPLVVGAVVVGPSLFAESTWAPRDFTMSERLLSECRIVVDYIAWTVLPMPSDLSFYHDAFALSTGWLQPWTTLACFAFLLGLLIIAITIRKKMPLFSLGIAWFFGCHALTATIIPLELIYEHRNYFSSLGLLMALVSLIKGSSNPDIDRPLAWRGVNIIICVLGLYLASMTAFSAVRWASPLSLAQELAIRAPNSPRAQYELGRTYIIASRYNPSSPLVKPSYDVLERAAALPGSSTLPEQALIFLSAKLRRPIEGRWWESMEAKLRRGPVAIEDESAIMSLSSCYLQKSCDLPPDRLLDLFIAALAHPNPRSRVFAAYSEFAWSGLGDHQLGYAMAQRAAAKEPLEPAYHLTSARYAILMGDLPAASRELARLESLNVGNRLQADIVNLKAQLDAARPKGSSIAAAPASGRSG